MKIEGNDIEYIYKFDEQANRADNSKKNDLDKDAFLRLLTVQLSNQDPLNPIEDREFIAQLAQFSSLEQIQNLNNTVANSSTEMIEVMDMMNINQIKANVEILKEITKMRKAMEAYFIEKSTSTEIEETVPEED